MAQPQVSNYFWDFGPFYAFNIRNISAANMDVFDTGILAGKQHEIDLKMDRWFVPCCSLRYPTDPNGMQHFNIPEAKVQLLSGNEVKGEFPLTFTPSDAEAETDTLEGRMVPPFLSPLPEDTFVLRLLFTLELKSGPFMQNLVQTVASGQAVASCPEKSAVSNVLFLKPTDLTVVCGMKEFLAHKDLLAEKSPVFRQMFEHEMRESLTGKLVLNEKEIAPDSVLQLLHFLYTGKMKASKDVCKDLFVTGEKYDLKELKRNCEDYLARILKPEDAVEFYVLAENHQGKLLKTTAVEMLKMHKTQLFPDAAAVQDFGSKHPQLMFQLFMN